MIIKTVLYLFYVMILHIYHIVHNIKAVFKSRYIYRTHIHITNDIQKIGTY